LKECALYIKIDRNICVHQPKVLLSDIAKIECERQDILRKIKNIVVHNFELPLKDGSHHNTVSVSVLKIIQMIHGVSPGSLVINEGETDFVIEYQKQSGKNTWIDKLKTVFLCIIVFFGSAFSIIVFNNDVNIVDSFEQFYYQALGSKPDGTSILEVCYCIGLAVGITVFFNHVGGRRITKDPTPIEVALRNYEEDVDKALIATAGREGIEEECD